MAYADIGFEATVQDSSWSVGNYTVIVGNNPASKSIKVNKVFALINVAAGASFKIGIFRGSGTTYECIYSTDTYTDVVGNIEADVDWDVQAGDMIGFYASLNVEIARSDTGAVEGATSFYKAGDHTTNGEQTYSSYTNTRHISVGGTFEETSQHHGGIFVRPIK